MRIMSEEKLQKLAEFIKQYARDHNGDSPGLSDIMEYMEMVIKQRSLNHINQIVAYESPYQLLPFNRWP